MFLPFFENLRKNDVPVSLREFLIFLKGMKFGLATYDMEAFYYLARVSMVKDERNIDKFDRAFAATFDGIEQITTEQVLDVINLPAVAPRAGPTESNPNLLLVAGCCADVKFNQ